MDFFIKSAAISEADELRRLLPSSAYQKATGVLEMITRSSELRIVYEDRAKEELDKVAFHIDTLEQGRAEGRAEGEIKGKLIGRIQLLQQLLSLPESPDKELVPRILNNLSPEAVCSSGKTELITHSHTK